LRPDNVIFSMDGHTNILDFDLAKPLEEHAAAWTRRALIGGIVTREQRRELE